MVYAGVLRRGEAPHYPAYDPVLLHPAYDPVLLHPAYDPVLLRCPVAGSRGYRAGWPDLHRDFLDSPVGARALPPDAPLLLHFPSVEPVWR